MLVKATGKCVLTPFGRSGSGRANVGHVRSASWCAAAEDARDGAAAVVMALSGPVRGDSSHPIR